VRAVASLQQNLSVVLVMVGDGPTRRDCENLSQELGLRKVVFPGAVAHEDIVDYLAAMDVAVIPSSQQAGFHYSPLKLKEYLATGRAVVAPDVGEMKRLLESGHDAVLYSAGSVSAMTAALETLVRDAAYRAQVGRQARITYDRLFTIDRQLDLVAEKLGLPHGRTNAWSPDGPSHPEDTSVVATDARVVKRSNE
jgi:glycosyltransferase involved in cell wall biosynthesis